MDGETERKRDMKGAQNPLPQPPSRTVKAVRKADGLSAALRSAYQSTVEEGVPDDLMDLIRQLK